MRAGLGRVSHLGRALHLPVAVGLVAALVTLTGVGSASAAGFTSQVQTPVGALNQKSILVGNVNGGTSSLTIPAGATIAKARLSFGAASDAATANDVTHQTVSLTAAPAAATSVVALAADLLTDSGGYRYVVDVSIPVNTTSVTVGGIVLKVVDEVEEALGDHFDDVIRHHP